MPTAPITFEHIRGAQTRIAPFVHRTPVQTCATIDDLAGAAVYLKCENLQKVGAFKYRGATNAVRQLTNEEAARGVCTHSSGNHAQALALAARVRGIPAYIVMPENAPAVKVAAVEGYGANITFCLATQQDREATAERIVHATGATFIHPYDNPQVIAGQGTTALELLEDVPDLDAVITPVGGGGLAAGCCIAARGVSQSLRLFAGEPTGADDAHRSLAAGTRQPMLNPDTIADGLRTSLGELTFPVLRDHLEAVITVTDEQIIRAMDLLWSRAKLVVEPSGAVPLAAVLSTHFPGDVTKVGVILSGGNVDLRELPF